MLGEVYRAEIVNRMIDYVELEAVVSVGDVINESVEAAENPLVYIVKLLIGKHILVGIEIGSAVPRFARRIRIVFLIFLYDSESCLKMLSEALTSTL